MIHMVEDLVFVDVVTLCELSVVSIAEVDRAVSVEAFMASPLNGVGARKPPPNRLGELVKPATPRTHLTKAERKRRESQTGKYMNPRHPGPSTNATKLLTE